MIYVEIDNALAPVVLETLTWSMDEGGGLTTEQPFAADGQASFDLLLSDGEDAPAYGSSVAIYDAPPGAGQSAAAADLLWAGTVQRAPATLTEALAVRRVRVEAVYVTFRLRQVRIWMRRVDTTLETWIDDINTTWLAGEGFTTDIDAGPIIAGARVYAGQTVYEVLRDLVAIASQAGYVYRLSVTPDKVITVTEQAAAQSAFSITSESAPGVLAGSFSVNPASGDYANTLYVEGGVGPLPPMTFQVVRTEAETLYDFFGLKLLSVTAFSADGAAHVVGVRGRTTSDPSAVDVLYAPGLQGVERLNPTSADYVTTETIEMTAAVEGRIAVVVEDPDEVALRGRVWGETVRLEQTSLATLIEEALAVLALRSRSSVAEIRYRVMMKSHSLTPHGGAGTPSAAAVDFAAPSLLSLDGRPVLAQTQYVDYAGHVDAFTGRITQVRAQVLSPALVAFDVVLWSEARAETARDVARHLFGADAPTPDGAPAAEPTLTHPAIIDREVLVTTATNWAMAPSIP